MKGKKAFCYQRPSVRNYIYSNIIILLSFLCLPHFLFAKEEKYEFSRPLMGSHFKLVFFAESDSLARLAAQSVFSHLEKLNGIMSDYLDGSEVNRLSALSGNGYWVKTSNELLAVLDSASVVSRNTDGAFDPTIGVVTQVWRRATRLNQFPDSRTIRRALKKKGYRLMEIDQAGGYVKLKTQGMRIDLGGIGKGYAADEGIRILQGFGIRSAMVDAGGDLALSAPPPGKTGWQIAVSTGVAKDTDRVLTLSHCGVATSGDTYRYIQHKGKRYSHIVDPDKGVGLTKEVRVTVVAPSGTRADALATAVSVVNKKKLTGMLRHFPGTKVWVSERKQKEEMFRDWFLEN